MVKPPGDRNGISVSMSSDGNMVAIGAVHNDGAGYNAGHVRVYSLSTVGIEENSLFNEASVFPNPSQGIVNIDLGNLKGVSMAS